MKRDARDGEAQQTKAEDRCTWSFIEAPGGWWQSLKGIEEFKHAYFD